MISETIINIDAIMPYVITFGAIILVGIALFLIHNLRGLKNFGKHDRDMTKIFLDKFPLVRPEFYSLNWREQQAENNQEIHELKKTVEYLTSVIEELKKKNG